MKKRLIALLLVLVLLLPAGIAAAASWYHVTTTSLKVRYLPSESAKVLGSYRKDYALTIRSSSGGWSYVTFSNGFQGYVQTRYVSKSSSYSAWISSDGTSLRKGPDGSFAAIASLAKGRKVTVLSHGSKYDYVSAGDLGKGYVMNGLLSKTKVKASGNSSESLEASGGNYDAYVLNAGYRKVNLRTYPNTSAPIIDQFSTGTKVRVLVHSQDWDKVQVDGQTGYMMTKFLTTSVPAGTPTYPVTSSTSTAYVVNPNGKKVNLRTQPSKSGSVITEVSPGTEVKVVEHGSSWDKIEVGGKTGWMMTSYLSSKKPDPAPSSKPIPDTKKDYTAYVNTANKKGLNLRRGAGQYSVITKIPYGGAVKVLDHNVKAGWDYVQYNGKKGYVQNAYLTMEKPGGAPADTGSSSKPAAPSYPRTMTVTSPNGKSVNVHKQASDNSSNVDFLGDNGRLKVGTKVTVTGVTKGWAHISYGGKTGWMHSEYLK